MGSLLSCVSPASGGKQPVAAAAAATSASALSLAVTAPPSPNASPAPAAQQHPAAQTHLPLQASAAAPTSSPVGSRGPSYPDLSIPPPLSHWSAVKKVVDKSSDAAEKISAAIETCTDTVEKLQPDATFASFIAHAAGAADIVGAIGSRAPLVGVVFAALSVAGKRIKDTEAARQGFNELYTSVMTTAQLVQLVEADQARPYPASVQQAVEQFWQQVYALGTLLYQLRGKNYVVRLWQEPMQQARLKSVRESIERAKSDLPIVIGLETLSIAQEGLTVSQHSLTINQQTLSLSHEMLAQLHAIHEAQSPPHPAIDETAYAQAIRDSFAQLLGVADVLNSEEGSPLRSLGLSDVFVPQDVCRTDLFSAAELDLPEEALEHLRAVGQLHDDVKSRLRVHSSLGGRPRRSGVEVLTDASIRRLVVLGHPGTGKSSLLRRVALRWAAASLAERAELDFPILVELKRYKAARASSPSRLTLLQYIANGGSINLELDLCSLSQLLSSGRRVLVMLDGLDELFEKHDEIVGDIRNFLHQFELPAVRTVVTSRIIGYLRSDFEAYGFQQFALQSLTNRQITDFVERWHQATYTAKEKETRDDRAKRLLTAVEAVPAIALLAKNPLLLTMIAIVNRGPELPTRRVQLYHSCAELLISKWQLDLAKEAYATTTKDILAFGSFEKNRLLRELAWQMQDESRPLGLVVQQEQLEALVCEHVNKIAGLTCPRVVVARALIDQLRTRHFILAYLGGEFYSFVHRTFLEYFCAAHYNDLWNRRKLNQEQLTELFRIRAKDSSWREVLILLSGMIPSEFMGPCLDMLVSVKATDLIIGCVEQLQDRNEAAQAVGRCRQYLTEIVRNYTNKESSYSAFDGLVQLWKDELTLQLLTEQAISLCEGEDRVIPRAYTLNLLVEHWPGKGTEQVLTRILSLGNKFLELDHRHPGLSVAVVWAASRFEKQNPDRPVARPFLVKLAMHAARVLCKGNYVPGLTEEEHSSLLTHLTSVETKGHLAELRKLLQTSSLQHPPALKE